MATAVVLVCLFVITLISLATLRATLARRQEVRSQEQKLQAEWLAQAGLERGRARLAADSKYSGEAWSIPAGELGTNDDALVTIAVVEAQGDKKARQLRVQADYPREPSRRARHTREHVFVP
jgi:type II secretory pathway component PulK